MPRLEPVYFVWRIPVSCVKVLSWKWIWITICTIRNIRPLQQR